MISKEITTPLVTSMEMMFLNKLVVRSERLPGGSDTPTRQFTGPGVKN
jgi:hypothetical protein